MFFGTGLCAETLSTFCKKCKSGLHSLRNAVGIVGRDTAEKLNKNVAEEVHVGQRAVHVHGERDGWIHVGSAVWPD